MVVPVAVTLAHQIRRAMQFPCHQNFIKHLGTYILIFLDIKVYSRERKGENNPMHFRRTS